MEQELANIKTLFAELVENPEKVNELTKEQIEELRRHNNPYGPSNRNKNANGSVCLSVTNLQEKYMIKLMMVAMTSFMFRMQQEYNVETGHRASELESTYVKKPKRKTELSGITIPENNAYVITRADDALKDYYHPKNNVFNVFHNTFNNTEILKSQLIKNCNQFHKFVENLEKEKAELQFLNDKIMESKKSIIDGTNSPSDKSVDKGKRKGKAISPEKQQYNELRDKIDNLEKEYNELITKTSKSLDLFNDSKAMLDKTLDKYVSTEIKRFLDYNYSYNPKIHLRMDRDPIKNDKYRKALKVDPKTTLPVDIFHTFQLYFDANYDELIKEVEAVYALKPELENTITVWEDGFPSKEDAQTFIDKNKDVFTVQILNVEKGKPYFYSSYEANREKLQYYNENTEILQAIETRVKEESKIGNELLKRRVQKIKSENIEKEGETSEGASQYLKENSSLLGVKGYSVLDEKNVQHIPVHSIDRKTGNLKTDTIYVEAEGDIINLSGGKITTANELKEKEANKTGSSSTDSSTSFDTRSEDILAHKNRRLETADFNKQEE